MRREIIACDCCGKQRPDWSSKDYIVLQLPALRYGGNKSEMVAMEREVCDECATSIMTLYEKVVSERRVSKDD